jgi:hypothetical protein
VLSKLRHQFTIARSVPSSRLSLKTIPFNINSHQIQSWLCYCRCYAETCTELVDSYVHYTPGQQCALNWRTTTSPKSGDNGSFSARSPTRSFRRTLVVQLPKMRAIHRVVCTCTDATHGTYEGRFTSHNSEQQAVVPSCGFRVCRIFIHFTDFVQGKTRDMFRFLHPNMQCVPTSELECNVML